MMRWAPHRLYARPTLWLWVTALDLVFLVAGCATTRTTLELGQRTVALIGFSPLEARVVDETMRAIGELPPSGSVSSTVAEGVEPDSSLRFEALFGFEFGGGRLLDWWTERIHRVERGSAWAVAVYGGSKTISLRQDFFDLGLVERIAALVHEARHADGDGFRHVECPSQLGLEDQAACDGGRAGPYAFQAAVLYELHARHLLDHRAARRAWIAARKRIGRRWRTETAQ